MLYSILRTGFATMMRTQCAQTFLFDAVRLFVNEGTRHGICKDVLPSFKDVFAGFLVAHLRLVHEALI